MGKDDKYGDGKNPPYSLYQGENGKWGLIDKDGKKLDAAFNRHGDENIFYYVPWESLTFDPQEGFDLVAWFDPDETWFNFTYDNPDYPSRWGKFLWKKSDASFQDCLTKCLKLLPQQSHPLIKSIDLILTKQNELWEKYDSDPDEADAEINAMIRGTIARYPALTDFAATGRMLEPILDNPEVPDDVKVALWRGKVEADSLIHDLTASE